jgi:hypothetical protein
MITKTTPAHTERIAVRTLQRFSSSPRTIYRNFDFGANSITYSEGAKQHGRWPWKQCSHNNAGSVRLGGRTTFEVTRRDGKAWYEDYYLEPVSPTTLPSVPAIPSSFLDESLKKCLDQVDLNTSDAVLLYSGVLQAVPLLGAVGKFNQIMKGIQRYVTKSLRKKPFTTVVKSLIQADFIDRFVISPTLADIRKFQDATDYTLRVLDTARSRNNHKFALNSSTSEVFSESKSTGTYNGSYGGDAYYEYQRTDRVAATCKAFMLLEASYNMSAVDPIKVWAQRVGLTRPLDSVWDLVPFSFVVDYFTRAGDFISHLSDEMSSIDGLKGKITSIHDVWCTQDASSKCTLRPGAMTRAPQFTDTMKVVYFIHDNSPSVSEKVAFRRFRVSNQWDRCMQLMRAPENYLQVNLDLSQTRKRTLAELIIQAKL